MYQSGSNYDFILIFFAMEVLNVLSIFLLSRLGTLCQQSSQGIFHTSLNSCILSRTRLHNPSSSHCTETYNTIASPQNKTFVIFFVVLISAQLVPQCYYEPCQYSFSCMNCRMRLEQDGTTEVCFDPGMRFLLKFLMQLVAL